MRLSGRHSLFYVCSSLGKHASKRFNRNNCITKCIDVEKQDEQLDLDVERKGVVQLVEVGEGKEEEEEEEEEEEPPLNSV